MKTSEWFKQKLDEFKNDPEFKQETILFLEGEVKAIQENYDNLAKDFDEMESDYRRLGQLLNRSQISRDKYRETALLAGKWLKEMSSANGSGYADLGHRIDQLVQQIDENSATQ